MLHPIPRSSYHGSLLRVVALQRRLLLSLCRLPEGNSVDLAWLKQTWSYMDEVWVTRFWNNDKRKRQGWILSVAKASPSEKTTLLDAMVESYAFSKLYADPQSFRFSEHNWSDEPYLSAKHLLLSFYDPCLYKSSGYILCGKGFHKDVYIAGFQSRVKVCPYTDTTFQDTKLDHFLPKDQFPFLSCHPDNLIPCSTDSNSGSHKGTKLPLDLSATEQAKDYFHPRYRPAREGDRMEFTIVFKDTHERQPGLSLVEQDAGGDARVRNLDSMFGLSQFWAEQLDDELQSIAADVSDVLSEENSAVTIDSVRNELRKFRDRMRRRIGNDDLAIVKAAYYEHILNESSLLNQILRTCSLDHRETQGMTLN